MTQHKIRTLDDGTRVYRNYHRYKPLEAGERTYAVRKPDDPRAVRFRSQWFVPFEVVSDEDRRMPETREDSEAYDHMPRPCACRVCRRPDDQVGRWRRKWQKDHGLRPKKIARG